MTRRKRSVVLNIAIVACSLISYLVVRGLGDGNHNVDEIVEHLSTPLVLWGWNPGNGHAHSHTSLGFQPGPAEVAHCVP